MQLFTEKFRSDQAITEAFENNEQVVYTKFRDNMLIVVLA